MNFPSTLIELFFFTPSLQSKSPKNAQLLTDRFRGHVKCGVCLAYLYAGSRVFSTQAAGQSPAAGGDVGHLGNGLHLLWTAYTHLQRKQQTVNTERLVNPGMSQSKHISFCKFVCKELSETSRVCITLKANLK